MAAAWGQFVKPRTVVESVSFRAIADVDHMWLGIALLLAECGQMRGEVPVGAVVVAYGRWLGLAWNEPIRLSDPTAHAEILAIRRSARRVGNYRLPAATLYVTLQPCTMCYGAIVQARLERCVFSARDLKAGALGGAQDLRASTRHNHVPAVAQGPFSERSKELLRGFFRVRRSR